MDGDFLKLYRKFIRKYFENLILKVEKSFKDSNRIASSKVHYELLEKLDSLIRDVSIYLRNNDFIKLLIRQNHRVTRYFWLHSGIGSI